MKLPHLEYVEHQPRSQHLDDAVRYGSEVVKRVTRTLMARDPSTTCKPGNNAAVCAKPTDDTQTLPIVLGVVIPLTCVIVVLIFLHRRFKKRQALEDANDPHKSLDFGVETDNAPSSKKGRKGRKGDKDIPEMIITDLSGTRPGMRPRGLSLDMTSSPFLLPAGLQQSRESIHSMSRTVQDSHDPYRPVTFMRESSEAQRSPSRLFKETGSINSGNTSTSSDNANLLQNAQRMSQSFPKRGDSKVTYETRTEELPLRQLHSNRNTETSRKTSASSTDSALPNITETSPPRKDFLPPIPTVSTQETSLPPPPEPPVQQARPPRKSSNSDARPLPRKESRAAPPPPIDVRPTSDSSYYGGDLPAPPAVPMIQEPEEYGYDADPTAVYNGRFSIDTPAPSQQYPADFHQNQVQNDPTTFMGVRPLPPDDPAENAEQRANRIRSFYKEYFDHSRPNPQQAYYEDFDPSYMGAAMYDSQNADYMPPQAPYAQPMGRRAMTPPPRGAGGPAFAPGAHDRHYSSMSAGRPGPRGRPAQRAAAPKKKLPPPKALTSLPTPHLLREDSALILNPTDFAPPTSFREIQNGRGPDSPKPIQRPYGVSVKPYSPLVSSFEDLGAMPSPHALRKSSTFTSLDFAPPRFRQEGGGSDSGSIRSARSGISPVQLDAVRAGAYRVSRIPKEYVTSREDLSSQLRPKMDLTNRA